MAWKVGRKLKTKRELPKKKKKKNANTAEQQILNESHQVAIFNSFNIKEQNSQNKGTKDLPHIKKLHKESAHTNYTYTVLQYRLYQNVK